MTVEAFFKEQPEALEIHQAIEAAVHRIGPAEIYVSRSQVGFRRKHPFAATWRPAQYLHGSAAPLVLSVFLRRRDTSPRWKEVVEAAPGRFTHHLELRSAEEVDDEVRQRLTEAWASAG